MKTHDLSICSNVITPHSYKQPLWFSRRSTLHTQAIIESLYFPVYIPTGIKLQAANTVFEEMALLLPQCLLNKDVVFPNAHACGMYVYACTCISIFGAPWHSSFATTMKNEWNGYEMKGGRDGKSAKTSRTSALVVNDPFPTSFFDLIET